MPRRNGNPNDWRRSSGSLNKRTIRAALFDAAARSADSFSSVAGRWSLSRRRRSRTVSDHKSRLRKRRSYHTTPRPLDDGSPALHTDTPFVIATTADDQRSRGIEARQGSSRYASFGSEAASGASLGRDARFVHPALRPTFDALRLLRKIPEVMAGWVHVKGSSGRVRRWPQWTLFWAELRGGYLLLTREANSVVAMTGGGAYPVDYIYGATHCVIVRSVGRNGSVRLRLRRTGGRTGGDREETAEAEREVRISDRSNTKMSTQSERKGLSARVASFAARMRGRASSMGVEETAGVGGGEEVPGDLVMKIPSSPEADKWEWALRNATQGYESKPLGDFQLIDALGAGAFGRVYLVNDLVKGEYLALKVLDKSLVFRDRLHFESAVNERLTLELVRGKPFMAQLRYAFQTRSCLYLVTDFYEGGDLFSFLKSHHNDVRESQAIRIIAEVVLALQSMHDMGIVYRDLKPENVLLDQDGHVRLADLGLAKLLDRENDYLTSTICGSLSYAAPEMLSEKQYGIAFDMWTLGVFIYQVLTGDMPFETENRNRQEILEDQRKAEIPMNGLSDEGYALVCALLRPNPSRRPTCRDLRQFPMFDGVDWDDLERKRPHRNSVKNVMDKIAERARKKEREQNREGGEGEGNLGGQSDAFLLRNFDPEEWSDMSFSDASEGASTASFFRPDFTASDELPTLTRMVPGWSLTTDNAVPLVKPQLAVSPLLRRASARNVRRNGDAQPR